MEGIITMAYINMRSEGLVNNLHEYNFHRSFHSISFAQDSNINLIEKELTQKQRDLLKKEREILKSNREAFKASLTKEQFAILKDKKLSKIEIKNRRNPHKNCNFVRKYIWNLKFLLIFIKFRVISLYFSEAF